jgi:hypothetical protein
MFLPCSADMAKSLGHGETFNSTRRYDTMRGIGIAAILMALALVGCGEQRSAATPQSPQYKVTVYSGGEAMQSWIASRIVRVRGGIVFYLPDSRQKYLVGGTFVAEPVGEVRQPTVGGTFVVKLYSDGKLVRTWEAMSVTRNFGLLRFQLPGSSAVARQVTIGGIYSVEPHN